MDAHFVYKLAPHRHSPVHISHFILTLLFSQTSTSQLIVFIIHLLDLTYTSVFFLAISHAVFLFILEMDP